MEGNYSGSIFAEYTPTEHSFTYENHSFLAANGERGFQDEIDLPESFPYGIEADELLRMVDKDVNTWTSEDLLGKSFNSIDHAEAFYKAYSMKVGFGVRRDDMKYNKDGTIVMRRWVCSREGIRSAKCLQISNRKREPRALTRCSCRAEFSVKHHPTDGIYVVSKFNPEHSHEVADSKHVYFLWSNRKIEPRQASKIQTMKGTGIRTCQIMDFMVTTLTGLENGGFTFKDLYNFIGSDEQRTSRLNTDAESTMAYLAALADNDPGLYARYAVYEGNKLNRIFWSDSRSRLDYGIFGDVIVVDSTYKTNTFKMPLVEFFGTNNHHTTVVFGCALVSEETIDAYTWVFRTFLHAMGGRQPISILMDGDRAIQSSISTVMPQARHRLCSWHLMRNAHAVCSDEEFLGDFKKCMLYRQSAQDFDRCWSSFLNKYNFVQNDWMDDMYQRKEMWAKAFFNGVFFAGMTTNQRCESMHAYMNRFLNSHLNLYNFVKQYHRAMAK